MRLSLILAGAALLGAAGCSGVTSSLRYGTDGQPEFFIECSNRPMADCYEKALALCPAGYFLVGESQTPHGSKSGSLFGSAKHVGGAAANTQVTFKNQLIVRCKPRP